MSTQGRSRRRRLREHHVASRQGRRHREPRPAEGTHASRGDCRGRAGGQRSDRRNPGAHCALVWHAARHRAAGVPVAAARAGARRRRPSRPHRGGVAGRRAEAAHERRGASTSRRAQTGEAVTALAIDVTGAPAAAIRRRRTGRGAGRRCRFRSSPRSGRPRSGPDGRTRATAPVRCSSRCRHRSPTGNASAPAIRRARTIAPAAARPVQHGTGPASGSQSPAGS